MERQLSVADVSRTLGTTEQTVHRLLRRGDLRGERGPGAAADLWVVPQSALDDYLDDGRPADPHPVPDVEARSPRRLPFFLRARWRATLVVLVVGVPLLAAWGYARFVPGALFFHEVGQDRVYARLLATRIELHFRVLVVVAAFVGTNLAVALRGTGHGRGRALGGAASSLVVGNLFASAADSHVETFLLWRHRQPFGEVDPVHSKDVGFYVFSLPFHLLVATWALWLVALAFVGVTVIYRVRGAITFRPVRAGGAAHAHLAVLAAAFLLVVAWRIQLQQYLLLLGQSSPDQPHAFAGAGYVDLNVTAPLLTGLTVGAVALAALCLLSPVVARTRVARPARIVLRASVAAAVLVAVAAHVLGPSLVQRYVVDPNPLLSEKPYLERSIAATRAALALDEIEVVDYDPEGDFDAADFAEARQRFDRLPTWDGYVVGARMRQLVTERPYFSPGDPVPDPVIRDGRQHLSLVSAREVDLAQVPEESDRWVNDRLSYTHGLGLLRFSSKGTTTARGPRPMDGGLGAAEPRLYYGDLPTPHGAADEAEGGLRLLKPTLGEDIADTPWVVANTRRAEVDVPHSGAKAAEDYHYDGDGGIALSSLARRAIFALALGSKDLLLSDEITPESRLMLHRDVHDRLHTLAPFIHWDAEAVPLTAGGRILFVVDGYTTSDSYPYAEQVALGDEQVSYARASVIATVDAFDGAVRMYVTDDDEPVLRAWRQVFPTLFTPFSQSPDALQGRLRYPAELFHAQAGAYERFHITDPDVFVSGAERWARPLALSGPVEVAGDVEFDGSDEDDLRFRMPPIYIWVPPPGQQDPLLVLTTYYSPDQGQNLVGSLNGWIDEHGETHLVNRVLPRKPVTLGPAQASRIVFSTPRVRNLLGLRNLEIRDVDRSSLDSVLLGRPRIMFLPGGIVQVQSLYEGSRGPGAARLLGVTAFVNGRAGLGPTVPAAVRQALNRPPQARMEPVAGPAVVGQPVELVFWVENARRQTVRVSGDGGSHTSHFEVRTGRVATTWVPQAPGTARVRIDVDGLDGTRTSEVAEVEVLGPPPQLRLVDAPAEAEVGSPVRIRFDVSHGVDQQAQISTRAGIVFDRRFEIRDGRGLVEWVPESPGQARLVIRARGTEDQTVQERLTFEVAPSTAMRAPSTAMVRAPHRGSIGAELNFVFRAAGCGEGSAAVRDADGQVLQQWSFDCPVDPARVSWTPSSAGDFTFTVVARGPGSTSESTVPLRIRETP